MTETTQIPISEFIANHGITIKSIRVDEQPGFVPYVEPFGRRPIGMMPTPAKDDEGWEHYAWSVHLHRGTTGVDAWSLATPWKAGTAHIERSKGPRRSELYAQWGEYLALYVPTPPTVEDVLDSLASDAASYDNARDFDDFCAEFGYDTDSRKAEKIYHALAEQAKALRAFLGREAYDVLLYETERL